MLTGVKDTESHRMAESLRRAGVRRRTPSSDTPAAPT